MNRLLIFIYIVGLAACGQVDPLETEVFPSAIANGYSESEELHSDFPKVFAEHHQNYLKPGADIRFSNNYDGYAEPGVEENFFLTLQSLSPATFVDLHFSTSDGMDLLFEVEQRIEMRSNSIEIPVSILAATPGQYRFRVTAIVDTDSEFPAARNYSLTINVGAEAISASDLQKASKESVITTPEGEKLIRRSAEETIY